MRSSRLVFLLFLAACGGQRLAAPGPSVLQASVPGPVAARVVALNTTAHARRDVITLTLPFADDSDYHGEPLSADGQAIDVLQLGAAWPDGSWRHATAYVPVSLGPGERRAIEVVRDAPPRPAFAWAPGLVAAAPALSFAVREGGRLAPFVSWTVTRWTPWVRQVRARARVPSSPVWAELTLEVASGIDRARLWLQVGDSDQRDPEVSHQLGRLEFLARGGRLAFDHAAQAQLSVPVQGVTTALLDPGSRWADGESIACRGRLVFEAGAGDRETAAAEAEAPTLVVADWRGTGAFGPWGEPATVPDQTAAALGQVPAAWTPATSWGPIPLGLARIPSWTGDQADFSAVVCSQEASGVPDRLGALAWSVLREAGRPTHLREADASPSRVAADRFWNSRPDRRISVSTWGKGRDLIVGDPNNPAGADGHLLAGRDQEHWSANYPLAYALLTSDPYALQEADHLAELWLASVKDGTIGAAFLDHVATASRGEGRPLQAGAWLWLVTGRLDVRDRLQRRIDVIAREWTGATAAPVRPLRSRAPDPRYLSGTVTYWKPWEEGLAVIGLHATWRVTGYLPALNLATPVASTVARWGIWQEGGAWTCGDAVEWVAGGAPSINWQSYPPFLPWAGAALVLALGQGETAAAGAVDQLRRAAAVDPRVAEWIAVR